MEANIKSCAESVDVEVWKPIPDFAKYEASTHGRIRSFKQRLVGVRILRPRQSRLGYQTVQLTRNDGKRPMCSVHRMVATTFIPNPNEYKTVDHIDRNPANNRLDNLCWASHEMQCQNKKKKKEVQRRTVQQICTTTGDVLNTFISCASAARWCEKENIATCKVQSMTTRISEACMNGTERYGFKWSFPDVLDLPGEVWKRVSCIFKLQSRYEVSTKGRVRTQTGQILKGQINSSGYVTLYIDNAVALLAHRLIAFTFLEVRLQSKSRNVFST